MSSTIVGSGIIIVALMAVGCGRGMEVSGDTSPLALSSVTGPSLVAGSDAGEGTAFGVFGSTLKETLSGPAIDGVVPQGEALADMSQFVNGGATILTVRIKNVNLPDGTRLEVTLDFTPIGTVTLSRGEGTLTTSLGHFGVSRDQVRINNSGATILAGGLFR